MSKQIAPPPNPSIDPECQAQRIDKWLWCARFFKTRSLAAKFVSGGKMRLTRDGQTQRVSKPSFTLRTDDELAFAIGARLWIVRIRHCGARRGPASEAQDLYTDHSPPAPVTQKPENNASKGLPSAPQQGLREKGTGRPTKKDRRALTRFQTH